MLQLSKSLVNRPVLSLRTGVQVGTATAPIMDPNNLKIEGFYAVDRFDKKKPKVLLYQDIRDLLAEGFVVNDHDAMSDLSDIVRLKKLVKMNFQLIGKPVFTEDKARVGKVNDFAAEVETMFVQKIYVTRPLHKSLIGGSLSVDRSQIVEITNKRIVIQDMMGTVPAGATA